jgi:hypothetical protein
MSISQQTGGLVESFHEKVATAHNFNAAFRDDPTYEVVAFTAAQIPGIAGQRYPPALLYYLSRFGFQPSKVAYMAWNAWRDASTGSWPETTPPAERVAYDLPTTAGWLEVFLERFFETSQFKRSAMPNAAKVGSGGSLSLRSDWRKPSDADAQVRIDELRSRVLNGG